MTTRMQYKDPKKLPGDQFIPTTASQGECFINKWCANCARDKPMSTGADYDDCSDDELCDILGDSFLANAVEWRELEDGSTLCVAFTEAISASVRDDLTIDMFEEAQ